jgi:phosphatidylglycerophosphate synthase
VTEGEAWARGLLSALRADGYRARAWLRFLARSFERAQMTWRQRSGERRQVFVVGVAGLAAWGAVASVRPWLALAGALWWLVVIAMLGWHLGMLDDEHGRRLPRLGLPNLLSLARAAVVPALPVASPALLAAILIPAGLSDGIDGPLARRRHEQTRLGVWLDGSADTLLLSAAAVGAARHGLLPWWTAWLVVSRQAAPWLLVSLAYFIHTAPPQIVRPVSGKAAGLLLFAGLLLSAFRLPAAVPLVVVGVAGGLAILTVRLVRSQAARARLGLPPPA